MNPNHKTAPDTPEQNPPKNPKSSPKRPKPDRLRRPQRAFAPEQKAQAVLAAWTERLSQTEICRQLQINYVTFQHWQGRAMEGMLQALDNQLQLNDTTVLNPRLRKLMERGNGSGGRFGRRLLKIQQERDSPPLL